MAVKLNDNVLVDYEGRLEDGTVFDSSKHGDHSHPLEFVVGSNMVIKGFENAVLGMEKGEEKEFSIEPKEAYGEYNPQLLQEIPRQALPKDPEPKIGMMLVMQAENGYKVSARIISVENSIIKIDINHPLAGKKLFFKIKVLEIKSP